MGSVGDGHHNAMCESIFTMLECERLARRRFTSQPDGRVVVFADIEECCNPARPDSGIGDLSQIAYGHDDDQRNRNDLNDKPSSKLGRRHAYVAIQLRLSEHLDKDFLAA
jgi:hypothetical protein